MFTSCQTARGIDGVWYSATIAFHSVMLGNGLVALVSEAGWLVIVRWWIAGECPWKFLAHRAFPGGPLRSVEDAQRGCLRGRVCLLQNVERERDVRLAVEVERAEAQAVSLERERGRGCRRCGLAGPAAEDFAPESVEH